MPHLPPEIYLPIAAALVAVIGLLWKRISDLYSELIQDSKSLQAITALLQASAVHDGEIKEVLKMLKERLEELHSKLSGHGG